MSDESKILHNPDGAAVRWHYRLPNLGGQVERCACYPEPTNLVFVRGDGSRLRQDGVESLPREVGSAEFDRLQEAFNREVACPDCGSETTTCWACAERAAEAAEAELEEAREVAREAVRGTLLHQPSQKFEKRLRELLTRHAWLRG